MRNWSASYPDFVNSMRWGRCFKIVKDDNQGSIVSYIDAIHKKYEWSFASFDFGFLFDDHNPKSIDKHSCDRLFENEIESLHDGRTRLPYEECAFLFRFMPTSSTPEAVNLIHLKETDLGISGSIYFKQNLMPPRNLWTKSPAEFLLTNNWEARISFDPDSDPSEEQTSVQVVDCEVAYMRCIYGLSLLNSHRPTLTLMDDATEQLARINRVRLKAKILAPLQATCVIQVDRQALSRSLDNSLKKVTSVRPHDRRGHYRNLSNGDRKWIKSTVVNGGSKSFPAYSIVTRLT
ncbi:hypothetical protein [Methylobacterium sp. J-070]|uniref:hypothetical protein n=1 Tax=Methylobacterium sp. J-070 TaxID=2836650 RepID=UPI001FBBB8D2|nr:hypothetical protein [Methylobacterium sp. J-070]MCJ2054686.1 hypothetical protein [Methylobacterium sp. J-070]